MSEPAPEAVPLVLTKQALVDLVQQEPLRILRAVRALLLRSEEDCDLLRDELIDRRQRCTTHERRGRMGVNRTDCLGALLGGAGVIFYAHRTSPPLEAKRSVEARI